MLYKATNRVLQNVVNSFSNFQNKNKILMLSQKEQAYLFYKSALMENYVKSF